MPVKLTYVPATKNDIESLIQFNKELIDTYEDKTFIDYTKVLEWVHHKIENHIHDYSRIIKEDQIVGYVHFHEFEDKMELDDLYIFPAFRNQGIGTEVIKKCLSETNQDVMLYVFNKNVRAYALYQKLGFQLTKKMPTRSILVFHQKG